MPGAEAVNSRLASAPGRRLDAAGRGREVAIKIAAPRLIVLALLLALAAPATGEARGKSNVLDLSFGQRGVVRGLSDVFGSPTGIGGVALASDRSVLIAGGGPSRFGLIRYSASGTLDQSFGTGGVALSDLSGVEVATDSAGRLLLGGTSSTGTDFGIQRLRADGSVDSSFGANGTAIAGNGQIEQEGGLAVAPDGSVFVAGPAATTSDQLPNGFAVAKLTPAGTPDPAFGSNGVITTPLGTGSFANALAVGPAGKIIVAGRSADRMIAVRYTPTGALDASFGSAGVSTLSFKGSSNASAIALQPDGKVVLAGYASVHGGAGFAVARLNPDGSPDSSFGNRGTLVIAVGARYGMANDVYVLPNGKILAIGAAERRAAGSGLDAAVGRFVIARYTPDGSLDRSYNRVGLLLAPVDATYGFGVPQPDARVLLAGGAVFKGAVIARVVAAPRSGPPKTVIRAHKILRPDKKGRIRVRFAGRGSGLVYSFRCSIQRRGSAAAKPKLRRCPSRKPFRHVGPGRYVLRAQAVDYTRRRDPTPAQRRIRVLPARR